MSTFTGRWTACNVSPVHQVKMDSVTWPKTKMLIAQNKNAEIKQAHFLVSISASMYKLALLEPQLDIEEMNK